MESFCGDTEESTEDAPRRKKFKLKTLKTRLFGKSKRAGGEENAKLSQSASDITAGEGLGSEEDLACSQGMMGSRALSHDSIFLADQVLTDAEPARVLSQENVHSKIKALQMKLQQQKMHLGPPPLVPPIRRPEDPESHSGDDGLSHSPPENSGSDVTSQGALSKTASQPFSPSLSSIPKPAPLIPSHPLPQSVEAPLDLSSPAQFMPCLDTSAARHRMSIKPRNQRPSTKKRLSATDSRSLLDDLNNIDHPESVKEEEQQWHNTQEETTLETERGGAVISITSEPRPSKSSDEVPVGPEASKSTHNFPQLDPALPGRVPTVPPQVLRVKPHRPADVTSSERPHSSFIPSEVKEKRQSGVEIQVTSHDEKNTPNKAGMTDVSSDQPSSAIGSVAAFRSSSVQQQVQGETESTGVIKRPAPGSGSFHFSITTAKNRDVERPRSGSFVGLLEQIESRHRAEEKPFSSMKEKAELRDFQARGGPFAVGRLRQEGPQPKCSVLPWERKENLKKVESLTPSKNAPTDRGAVEGEEVEVGQEVLDEAVEAQEVEEDEGKKAFGIKLRSTSQSMRYRSETSSNHNTKPPMCEEQCDKQKKQETTDNDTIVFKKLSTNNTSTSGDLRMKDPAPSGFSLSVKHNPPLTCEPHIMPTEPKTNSSSPKEVETALAPAQEPKLDAQTAPQAAPSEVSWMSLAMEKTRSLQQLFTSRFPRDFTGAQTAARPQPQAQTVNQTETQTVTQIQTQTVKAQSKTPQEAANQPLAEAVKAETVQTRNQAQTVKAPLMVVQQKTLASSAVQPNVSKEQQTSKQTGEPQAHPNTTQSASQSASVHTNPRTTLSPSCCSAQTETSSQFAQSATLAQSYLSLGPQQPTWSNRSLHPTNQLKPTTSAPTSASSIPSSSPPVSALGKEEKEATVQENEGGPTSGRRPVWAGSVSEKAAFLEKRAEWTASPGTKGVEVKKAQIEVQTLGESAASAKIAPLSKDTKPEGVQGLKPAESSPTKVPDRPREDKWLRKNAPSSSSPSSSPIMSSALQSMSDSGQPSWMELAKRKSMAWSDKSMD